MLNVIRHKEEEQQLMRPLPPPTLHRKRQLLVLEDAAGGVVGPSVGPDAPSECLSKPPPHLLLWLA
eukprot:CAMPEP_0172023082 /NCGR_PEP_ID=MMETSP1041-20130122/14605_1 /TAXON_ID=464988 /ORGANISM="Hemiselmis andersenii, Strain CCMP439" /LENGTH=65 /DNA_ID=CAMNT_0012678549 /DNA_START=431 /DNA_END=628 /DNA_ORIENTATION=-